MWVFCKSSEYYLLLSHVSCPHDILLVKEYRELQAKAFTKYTGRNTMETGYSKAERCLLYASDAIFPFRLLSGSWLSTKSTFKGLLVIVVIEIMSYVSQAGLKIVT